MVHAPNPATVEIYYSPGIDPGKKTSAFPYQKIYNGTIFGQGDNNVTSLPELVSPVVIPAGASYSFYITVANFSLGYMQCTRVSSVGGVSASNEFVEVLDGYSMGHPFLYYNPGYRWNGEKRTSKVILFYRIESFNSPSSSSSSYSAGNVYYSVETFEPTQAPSSSPTVVTTLSPTSSHPTTSKPASSTPTTLFQTSSPTTKRPTLKPTTSTPTTFIQTQSPTTKQPTPHPETSVPSRAPSSNFTSMPTMSPTSSKGTSLRPATITPTSSFQTPSPVMTPTVQPSYISQTSGPSIQPTRQPSSLPISTPIDPSAALTSAPVMADDSSSPDPTKSDAPSDITDVVTRYLPRKPSQTFQSSKEQVRVNSALLVVGVLCVLAVVGLMWVFPGACSCAHFAMCATRRNGRASSY